MRFKIVLLVVLITSIPLVLEAQIEETQKVDNSIYLEIGGSALGYSLNYERRVGENLWGRVGVSYLPPFVVFGDFVSLPAGLSYLLGKYDKHLELGFTLSPTYIKSAFKINDNYDKEFGIISSAIIGYRFQPKEELFFKLAFTPLITTFETTFLPSGGISFGYSF